MSNTTGISVAASKMSISIFLVPLTLVICLVLFGESKHADDSPMVTIPQGSLKGKHEVSRDGKTYAAFLGIPYANTPIRFKMAEPPTKWKGVRDATKFGSRCLQANLRTRKVFGSEDCLFLNVYSHNLKAALPVMVFVHGGAFTGGCGELGANFMMDEDIVFVALNYRLGALGFLNTGDGEVEGNLGLKDQVMALRWVQENIHHFGGDKSKVTIFGESAGGSSVQFLTLSSMAKGLFHGTITESGSALNPWSIARDPGGRAKELGKKLGCSIENSKALVQCLRNSKAEDIGSQNLATWYVDPFAFFAPSVESATGANASEVFLLQPPQSILEAGTHNKIPIMFTVGSQEGAYFHAGIVAAKEKLRNDLNNDWLHVAPITLDYLEDKKYGEKERDWISKEVRKFYFGKKPIGQETLKNLTNLYTDRLFVYGVQKSLMLHSKYAPTYAGIFAFPPTVSLASKFGINETEGFAHGDELQFLFPGGDVDYALPPLEKGSRDELLSKKLVKIWTTFAKTLDPGVKYGDATWAPVSSKEVKNGAVNFLNLNISPEIMMEPFKERTKFWDHVLDLKSH